jgi:MFS family permease
MRPAADSTKWKALIAAALGWLFDGYESFVLVLVGAIAVRQVLPPDQVADASAYFGGLIAATLVGWATGGVISGVLSDYIGRKRTLMLSILCYALFTGLTAFSGAYWMLVLFRFLTGLGLGGEWGPGAAMVCEMWPAAVRGRAASALQSAYGVGILLASAIWLMVAPLGPAAWRYMFLIGVAPAFLILYIRRGLQDPALWCAADDRRRAAVARAASGQAVAAEDRALLQLTVIRLVANPALRRRLVPLLVMSAITIIGYWGASTWIPQYAGQIAAAAGRDARDWISLAGIASGLGAIAGYLVFGVLADTWGRKPMIWVYYLGSLPAVWVPFLLVRDPALFLLAVALNGFFTTGQFSWMPIYLPELFPTAVRGSAISVVFNSARYLAAAGPLVAGAVITMFGGIGRAASMIALVYVVGLIVTPFAGPETKGKPLPE